MNQTPSIMAYYLQNEGKLPSHHPRAFLNLSPHWSPTQPALLANVTHALLLDTLTSVPWTTPDRLASQLANLTKPNKYLKAQVKCQLLTKVNLIILDRSSPWWPFSWSPKVTHKLHILFTVVCTLSPLIYQQVPWEQEPHLTLTCVYSEELQRRSAHRWRSFHLQNPKMKLILNPKLSSWPAPPGSTLSQPMALTNPSLSHSGRKTGSLFDASLSLIPHI